VRDKARRCREKWIQYAPRRNCWLRLMLVGRLRLRLLLLLLAIRTHALCARRGMLVPRLPSSGLLLSCNRSTRLPWPTTLAGWRLSRHLWRATLVPSVVLPRGLERRVPGRHGEEGEVVWWRVEVEGGWLMCVS